MSHHNINNFLHKNYIDIPDDYNYSPSSSDYEFDKDGSGTISVTEIVKIMKNFGYPIKKSEAQQMIADIDDNGDGELDFEEFVTLMEKQTNYVEETDEELVLRAFKSFDNDHDGKITNYEFKYILTQMGNKFSEDELNQLFDICKLDLNGTLTYQDFINFWKMKK